MSGSFLADWRAQRGEVAAAPHANVRPKFFAYICVNPDGVPIHSTIVSTEARACEFIEGKSGWTVHRVECRVVEEANP